jgi:hypothetical protein
MEDKENGFRFRSPAKETLDRLLNHDKKFDNLENSMEDLSTKFQLMQKDISTICDKLDENKEEHKAIRSDQKAIIDKIDMFLTGCDTKYASKSVERILFWVGAIIGAGILGAILKTILK